MTSSHPFTKERIGRKMMIALAAAAAIAAGSMSVSAESLWKYNDTTTIDMQETSIKKTTNAMRS